MTITRRTILRTLPAALLAALTHRLSRAEAVADARLPVAVSVPSVWTESGGETITVFISDVPYDAPVVAVSHDGDSVMDAYARYDSDPRVHGPDDFEAFWDAVDWLRDEAGSG